MAGGEDKKELKRRIGIVVMISALSNAVLWYLPTESSSAPKGEIRNRCIAMDGGHDDAVTEQNHLDVMEALCFLLPDCSSRDMKQR